MRLIIAEKPSLARNIVSAIGNMRKGKGFYTDDQTVVTWAFGHLFSLCDIETYQPLPEGQTRWSMENIPCFPKKYQFELRKNDDGKPDEGIREQFEIIRGFCRSCDTILNAGDSDREGEIIIRIIIDHALTKEEKEGKTLQRLWLPDQTPETIRKALANPDEEKQYDTLAYEGYSRTFIDWLYGVNLTRYATLKTGTLLRVGRVIVPIVKAIYDRDMAIRHFVPDHYYALCSQKDGVELTSKQKFPKNEWEKAQALCDTYNTEGAVVTELKKKKETVLPGKLFSLSKLQSFLGKKFKMSMNDSLATLQKLYEEGYVSYPRTNSEYLATAEKDKIRGVLEKVKAIGYPVEFKDGKTIFDDTKIESHSALTPTTKIPQKEKLSQAEATVYGAIVRRFVAVFCSEPCIADKSELQIAVGKDASHPLETFSLKGTILREPGWTKYDDYTVKDKVLPSLKKGDPVPIAFCPTEKETSPPKHYTIETLNAYLKNPFREEIAQEREANEEVSDEEEYRAMLEGLELGTEATRTSIIDNARKSKYIELKKDVYTILPDGEYLIESLSRMKIGMDKFKTAKVGQALKKVFHGEMRIVDSLAVAKEEIAAVFEEGSLPEQDDGFFGDQIGICPLCGKEVVKGKYGYGCLGYKEGCRFRIPSYLCGRIITVQNAKRLLSDGKTDSISGFVSKNGKKFNACLVLRDGKTVFDFQNPASSIQENPNPLPQEKE